MVKKLQLTIMVFLFTSAGLIAQSGSIEGRVTDSETGDVLPGTNVFIEQLKRGTSTNTDGKFLIENVPSGTYTLRASFIGYLEYTQEIEVDNSQVTVNIELNPANIGLDELVVVGFGSQSRRKLTSSVSSVNSEDFEGIKLNTIENALQGNAAGVQVTQSGGTLGSPVSVRVRGAASINANSQPLYVIDGIPITTNSGGIGNNISGTNNFASNPLINLNPDDIENIQILKDAAASAIYGSRGANGVVLITTKSGQPGTQSVNVGYSAGFTEETDRYDMLNGPQFSSMFNDAVINRFGEGTPTTSLFSIPNPDVQPTAAWMDLVHQRGFVQEIHASVSGGNERTQYFISGSFDDEQGYLIGDELDRFNARLKINHELNENVRIGLNIAPSLSRRDRRSLRNQVDAPITYAALYFPNVQARNEDGTPNLDIGENPFPQFPGTPLSNLEGTNIKEQLNQVISTANVQWNILPELVLNTDFTVELFELRNEDKRSDITTDGFGVGSGSALFQEFVNYNLNMTLNYTNTWDVHDLDAMVGYSMQRSENTQFDVSGNGFPSNDLLTLNSAADITTGGGLGTTFAFQGVLSRISYTYDRKYIFTLNGRYDGSSRFGQDEEFGFFPAASVGWIISDENFWSRASNVVDFLKLRASFGVTGNADFVGATVDQQNFPSLGLANVGSNYNGTPGFSPSQVANPVLQWEQAKQLDIGIDYGILDSRIRGSIGFYIKQTEDLLLGQPISATNGFNTITRNVGEMKNTGFEFDITADILTGPFRWTSSLNISTLENEVESLVSELNNGEQIAREGEPLGAFFLREYAGANPENGLAVYYVNGDVSDAEISNGTVFKNEERFGDRYVTQSYNRAQRIIAGDPFADIFGGWRNNFAYKGVDFSFFFQYNIGNELYLSDGEFLQTNMSSIFNQSTSQLDYWKEPGDITDTPKPVLLTNNGNLPSTRYLQDASYVRLKSVTFGYTLPPNLTENYQVRFFASGTNILTFKDDSFFGLDPEVTSAPSNNLGQGNVFFAAAQARTFRFGIEFNF